MGSKSASKNKSPDCVGTGDGVGVGGVTGGGAGAPQLRVIDVAVCVIVVGPGVVIVYDPPGNTICWPWAEAAPMTRQIAATMLRDVFREVILGRL